MSTTRQRVYAHAKQNRYVIENCENASVWTGTADVTDIAVSANHREGTQSISFDKDGTTLTTGQISRTYDAEKQLNLVDYLRGKLRYWIYVSSLTDIAHVQLIIGESASHNNIYQTADTTLVAGWNEITVDLDTPSSVTGNGAAWSSIGYVAVKVTFDASGNTLTGILVDAISVIEVLSVLATLGNASGASSTTPASVAQPTIDSYQQVAINLAAGANQVLVASAANKQIWVYGYQFTVNAAGTVSFQDEDDTAISGIMPFGSNGGASVAPSGSFAMPIWKLGTNKDLEVDVVTSELDGWLTYAIVSV